MSLQTWGCSTVSLVLLLHKQWLSKYGRHVAHQLRRKSLRRSLTPYRFHLKKLLLSTFSKAIVYTLARHVIYATRYTYHLHNIHIVISYAREHTVCSSSSIIIVQLDEPGSFAKGWIDRGHHDEKRYYATTTIVVNVETSRCGSRRQRRKGWRKSSSSSPKAEESCPFTGCLIHHQRMNRSLVGPPRRWWHHATYDHCEEPAVVVFAYRLRRQLHRKWW